MVYHIISEYNNLTKKKFWPSQLGLQDIPTVPLQGVKTPPNEYPHYFYLIRLVTCYVYLRYYAYSLYMNNKFLLYSS